MTRHLTNATVLIIEDGDEYLETLARFVTGPRYLQAHDAETAVEVLRTERVDLVYLDMRFDRIDHDRLAGDHAAATADHNGDPVRAWRFLQDNQGLFVLDALRAAGYGAVPTVLAYDFSREPRRWARLHETYPSLAWVSDAVTGEEIRDLMLRLMG